MTLLEQFQETVKTLKKETPAQTGAFMEFMGKVESGGVLPPKEQRLILVAVAVALQCDSCIAVHVAHAVKAGATREEIIAAGWLAVVMGGGPKLTYMKYVLAELANNGL